MTEIPGVDFSLARPAPSVLVRAGFRFAMGYVSTSPSKNLTAQNVRDYLAAGLSVGLVWETTADRALAGAAAGAADGAAADWQADRLGYPVDAPIFFAVDLAVSLSQVNGPIRAYAVAFDAAMKRPAGVYGSFLVVNTLVTPGQRPVRYGWQTAAWSRDADGRDQLSSKAHIYQRATPSGHWPVIPGTDENVLCAPLPLAGPLRPTPPAPHPTPTPTPTPAPEDFDMPYSQWPQADKDALKNDLAGAVWNSTFTAAGGPLKGQKVKGGKAIEDIWHGVTDTGGGLFALVKKIAAKLGA